MENDYSVFICASLNGINFSIENAFLLSNSDSSCDSLLSVYDGDSSTEDFRLSLTSSPSAKNSHDFKESFDSSTASLEENLYQVTPAVNNLKKVCKSRSLSFDRDHSSSSDAVEVSSGSLKKVILDYSTSGKGCETIIHRNSPEYINCLKQNGKKNQLIGDREAVNSCLNLCSDQKKNTDRVSKNIVTCNSVHSKSKSDSINNIVDSSEKLHTSCLYFSTRPVLSSDAINNFTNSASPTQSAASVSLKTTISEWNVVEKCNHSLSEDPNSTVAPSVTNQPHFEKQPNLSHSVSTSSKSVSSNQEDNKFYSEYISKSDDPTLKMSKNRIQHHFDINSNEVKASENKISATNKRKLNSDSNRVSTKKSKGSISLEPEPLNQIFVPIPDDNEIKISVVQPYVPKEVLINETSSISDISSIKNKIRQVFPTKRTKSRLSDMLDDFETLVNKSSHLEEPTKKAPMDNFSEISKIESNSSATVHSTKEVNKINFELSVQDSQSTSAPLSLSQTNLLVNMDADYTHTNTKLLNPQIYSDNFPRNRQNRVNVDIIQRGHKTNAYSNKFVVSSDNNSYILNSIPGVSRLDSGTFTSVDEKTDIAKNGCVKKSFYRQSPFLDEKLNNYKADSKIKILEKVSIPGHNDLSKVLNNDKPCKSPQQISSNSDYVHKTFTENSDKLKIKGHSAPCLPIVGRISPLRKDEFISSTPKSFDSELQFCKGSSDLLISSNMVNSNVAKITPNCSDNNFLLSINISTEKLKEKLGLNAKPRYCSKGFNGSEKKKKRSCVITPKKEQFHTFLSPDKKYSDNLQAVQRLVHLLDFVKLSKDYLEFSYEVIETLLSEARKCALSKSKSIFKTLAAKNTISALTICKFILEKKEQTHLSEAQIDNIKISLKAIEEIITIASKNAKLSLEHLSNATLGMEKFELFHFIRAFIDCNRYPMPNLEELDTICKKVKHFSNNTDQPENLLDSTVDVLCGKYNVVVQSSTSTADSVSPVCNTSCKQNKFPNSKTLSHSNSVENTRNNVKKANIFLDDPKDASKHPGEISFKPTRNGAAAKTSSALISFAVNNVINKNKDKNDRNYVPVLDQSSNPADSGTNILPAAPTRGDLKKLVENFFFFTKDIQEAVMGYLLELSQTTENKDYASRLIRKIKELSA